MWKILKSISYSNVIFWVINIYHHYGAPHVLVAMVMAQYNVTRTFWQNNPLSEWTGDEWSRPLIHSCWQLTCMRLVNMIFIVYLNILAAHTISLGINYLSSNFHDILWHCTKINFTVDDNVRKTRKFYQTFLGARCDKSRFVLTSAPKFALKIVTVVTDWTHLVSLHHFLCFFHISIREI